MDNSPNAAATRLQFSVRSADSRVELAANTLLRSCLHRLGMAEAPLPIPVEEWIESPLGYTLGFASVKELGPNVLGRARPTEGEITISESLLEQPGRLRFTCAHELGHLVLHKHVASELTDADAPHRFDAHEIEREADRFAAALLVPVSTIGVELEKIRAAAGLNSAAMLQIQGNDVSTVRLWRTVFLPALAERYGVSIAAMVYRCRELRLPGQRRLLKPSIVSLLLAPADAIASLELDRVRIVDGSPAIPDRRGP